jgi:hypothetical protein
VAVFALSQRVDNIPSSMDDTTTVGDDDQAGATAFSSNPTAVSVFTSAVAATMGVDESDVQFVGATEVVTSTSSASSPARFSAVRSLLTATSTRILGYLSSKFKTESSSKTTSLAIQFTVTFITQGNDMSVVTANYEAMTSAFSDAVASGTFTQAIIDEAADANFTALSTVSASDAPSVTSGPVMVSEVTARPTHAPTVQSMSLLLAAGKSVNSITETVFGVVIGICLLVGPFVAYKRSSIAQDHVSTSTFQVCIGVAISAIALAAQLSLATSLFSLQQQITSLFAVACAIVITRGVYFLSSVVYVFAFVNGSSDAALTSSDWTLTLSTVCMMCVQSEAAAYLPWTDGNRKSVANDGSNNRSIALQGFPTMACMQTAYGLTLLQAIAMTVCSVIAFVELAHHSNGTSSSTVSKTDLGYVCILSIGASVLLGGYTGLTWMFARVHANPSRAAPKYEFKPSQPPISIIRSSNNDDVDETEESRRKKSIRRRSKELESGGNTDNEQGITANPSYIVNKHSSTTSKTDTRRKSRASLVLDSIESESTTSSLPSPHGVTVNRHTQPKRTSMQGSSSSSNQAPSMLGSPIKLTPVETVLASSPNAIDQQLQQQQRRTSSVNVHTENIYRGKNDDDAVLHSTPLGQMLPTRVVGSRRTSAMASNNTDSI